MNLKLLLKLADAREALARTMAAASVLEDGDAYAAVEVAYMAIRPIYYRLLNEYLTEKGLPLDNIPVGDNMFVSHSYAYLVRRLEGLEGKLGAPLHQ